MNNLDVLRNFGLYGKKKTLFNLLDEYELFKETIEKPGDIIILGENIAMPLITFANFSEVQTIGDRTRLVYGFDKFKKNENYNNEDEYLKELQNNINIYDQDRFVGWKDRIIYDNTENSFENFLKNNIGIKISLLYCKDIKEDEEKIRDIAKTFMLKNGKIIFV